MLSRALRGKAIPYFLSEEIAHLHLRAVQVSAVCGLRAMTRRGQQFLASGISPGGDVGFSE